MTNNSNVFTFTILLFFNFIFSMNHWGNQKNYIGNIPKQKLIEKIYLTVINYDENKDDKEILKLMENQGSDKDIRALKLKYILIYSSTLGIYDLAFLAIKLGAKYDCHFDFHNQSCNSTPLTLVCRCEKNWWENIYNCSCNGAHEKIFELLISSRADLNLVDRWGYTPLIWASLKANDNMVKFLLMSGADFKVKNNDGRTALTVTKKELKLLEKKILEFGSKSDKNTVDSFYSIKEKYKLIITYLNRAYALEKIVEEIKLGNKSELKALLIKEPKILDFFGNNILHISSRLQSIKMFKFIFGLIPEYIHQKNYENKTPIDINQEMLIYLILHKKNNN